MRPAVCQAGWLAPGYFVQLVAKREGEPYRIRDYDRCHRPATHRFSTGCVHEHLTTWLVCEGCALALMAQWRETNGSKNQARCTACRSADGHVCPVLASAEAGVAS
jgi:hypothetical protein